MILIDRLCYISNLRETNPGEKFAFTILTLCICVGSRSIIIGLVALLVTGFLTVCKGKIPLKYYLNLMSVPMVFIILSTLAIIINFSKVPLSAYAFQVGNVYITSSRESIELAIRLVCTSLSSVSCLYFLSLSTPMTDILMVLKKCRCPDILIELMLLIYRFIFILLDIAYYILTSQNARLGNKDFKTSCKSMGALFAALLVRAFQKSSALYDAMESRCYDGTIRVLSENYPPRQKEIIYIIVFEVFLISLWVGIRIWN